MKVTLIGGGGFRAPMLDRSLAWGADAIGIDEVVSYDTDEARLRSIADVLQAMDEERGGGLPRRTTTDLDDALDGAGAVLAAIRVAATPAASWTRPSRSSWASSVRRPSDRAASRSRSARCPSCGRSRAGRGPRARRVVPELHEPRRPGDRGDAGHPRRPGGRHLRLPHLARTSRRRGAGAPGERARARLRRVEPPRLADGGPRGRPRPAARAAGERSRHGRGGGAPVRPRARARAGHDPQRVPRVLRAGGRHRADDARARRHARAAGGGAAVRVLRRALRRTGRRARRVAPGARCAPPHVHGRGRRRPGDDRGRRRSDRRTAGRGLRRRRGGVPSRRRDRRRGATHREHGEHGAAAVPGRRRRGGGADAGGPRGVHAGRGRRAAPRAAGAGDPREGGRTPDAPRLVRAVRRPRDRGDRAGIPSSTPARSPNGSSRATWSGSRGSRTCSTTRSGPRRPPRRQASPDRLAA